MYDFNSSCVGGKVLGVIQVLCYSKKQEGLAHGCTDCRLFDATSPRMMNGIMGKTGRPLFTMATGTLPFAINRYKLSVTLLILMHTDAFFGQQFIFPFKAPSDCSVEEFFDISSLSCVRCGPNQRRSTTGWFSTVTNRKIFIWVSLLPETCSGKL